MLVPTEQVLLLAVDLPLRSHAQRLQALPFAVEDRVAESLDSVHLALGARIEANRYLVGVVRHDVMAGWVAQAEAGGLGHAPLVPDALVLPQQAEGSWAVELTDGRALVRTGDGAGFACPAALLRPAWEAAGRPPVHGYGEPLPDDMQVSSGRLEPANRAQGALDLRQGRYARRRGAMPQVWRRIAWVVALGAAAHTGIALADTVMLRVIADRRAEETRKLVAVAAPGANLAGDLATTVADMLPQGGAPQVFAPLLSRVSRALAPLGGALRARAIGFEGNALTLDFEPAEPGLAARLRAALAGAQVAATVAESPDGTIRVTASQ